MYKQLSQDKAAAVAGWKVADDWKKISCGQTPRIFPPGFLRDSGFKNKSLLARQPALNFRVSQRELKSIPEIETLPLDFRYVRTHAAQVGPHRVAGRCRSHA